MNNLNIQMIFDSVMHRIILIIKKYKIIIIYFL